MDNFGTRFWTISLLIVLGVPSILAVSVEASVPVAVWHLVPRLVKYSARRLNSGTHRKQQSSASTQRQPHHSGQKLAHGKERQIALHCAGSEIFLSRPPEFDRSKLPPAEAHAVREDFMSGEAANYSPVTLIRAGAFIYQPMRGGVYERRDSVKYIVMHSTETGRPADAKRVIHSWGVSGSLAHPGAQFVVDRDGTIYNTVTPDMATVHINTHKTLPGYSNDNSIGIEMVHTTGQTYTSRQVSSVVQLVTYLQNHYHVSDDRVVSHKYVQPSDRSDPVGFDLAGFQQTRIAFREQALALRGMSPAIPSVSAALQVHAPYRKYALPSQAYTPPARPLPGNPEGSTNTMSPVAPPSILNSCTAMPPVAPRRI